MSKIYKNWAFHNLIAHPVSELLYWFARPLGKAAAVKISTILHDSTIPAEAVEND